MGPATEGEVQERESTLRWCSDSLARPTIRSTLGTLLFPDPPRRVPGHRAIGIALRTAHLASFGPLLGGHFFDVEPSRLLPLLLATIATGAGLVALELASTCTWLFMGKGVLVLVKLLLLAAIPVFWEHRLWILLLVVVVASVGSHMPSRFRHHCWLRIGGAEGRHAMVPKGVP